MNTICCSYGNGLSPKDEVEDKDWQNALRQIYSYSFPIETYPHCGAPVSVHLVH